MNPVFIYTIIACLSLVSVLAAREKSAPPLSEQLNGEMAVERILKTPPKIPLLRASHVFPVSIHKVQKSPLRIPSVMKSPMSAQSVVKPTTRVRVPNVVKPLGVHDVVKQRLRVPGVVKPRLRVPDVVKPPMRVPDAVIPRRRVSSVVKPRLRVPDVVKPPMRVPDVFIPRRRVSSVVKPRLRAPGLVKPRLRVSDVAKPPIRVPDVEPRRRVASVVKPPMRVPDALTESDAVVQTTDNLPPRDLPPTEEEMLLRRQEWTEAGKLLPESHPYGKDVVHDVRVGERGITALRDERLKACFINHYINPFLVPTGQRAFYTHNMPATVAESDDEVEEFRNYVGPIVAQHCHHVKSYWLDLDMFHEFTRGDNQSKPKTDPPIEETVPDRDVVSVYDEAPKRPPGSDK